MQSKITCITVAIQFRIKYNAMIMILIQINVQDLARKIGFHAASIATTSPIHPDWILVKPKQIAREEAALT